jgi:YfiR/HmsC-like
MIDDCCADNEDPILRAGKADPGRNTWGRRSLPLLAGLFAIFSVWAAGRAGAQSNDEEYRVKAAFLFHFAQLVDWPADTLKDGNNSLFLCTLGDDPFQGALESTVAGKAVGTRVIRIRHLRQPQEIQGCQVLFLGKAQKGRIPVLLSDMRKAPVLTVGETSGFLSAGGTVCFLLEQDKVRFDINMDAAKSAGLKIGSQLLFLANNVVGQREER